MPLLDSALAFAITMLALSLACSAVVELIHRIFKMRQSGFKYMLDQMFDQVLSKYVEPAIQNGTLKGTLEEARKAFVERMRANRAPMGVPNATPDVAAADVKNKSWQLGVWGGRELTELSPVGFMERLGTMDIGTTVASAADDLDATLKDVAQKFEAFGKDAADYFEGRARLISVAVAVVFAFVVHADAVDLYKTYLLNPNATAAVIAKSQAITAEYNATRPADEKKTPDPSATPLPGDNKKQAEAAPKAVASYWRDNRTALAGAADRPLPEAAKAASTDDAKPGPEAPQQATPPSEGQKELEGAKKAALAAIAEKDKVVKQFTDLGVPLGWSDNRIKAADMRVLIWTCKELPEKQEPRFWTIRQKCKSNEEGYVGPPGQYQNVWFGLPQVLNVWIDLLLGGLLIGLGAPFWFNVITTITNIRNGAGGAGGATGSAAQAPAGSLALRVSPEADKAQPATPAGAFQVAQAAKK